MKKIQLTQGKTALVNDADYEWLNQWKWCAKKGNSVSHIYYAARRTPTIRMHRLILGLRPNDKTITDHIDGNGLNNQRSNLRVCTRAENNRSSRKHKVCSSKYKGVSWHPQNRKWCSYIRVNRKRIYLGSFDSEVDAAQTYNIAALKYFDEFALLNTF